MKGFQKAKILKENLNLQCSDKNRKKVSSVFSSHSLWLSFLGLRFCAFSSQGSGYIGQLSLLPVVHEQVNMLNFSWQFDGFENCYPQDITVVTATCHDVKVSHDMHQLYYIYNKYHGVLIQSVSKTDWNLTDSIQHKSKCST